MKVKNVENRKKFWYNIAVKSGAVITAFLVAAGVAVYGNISTENTVTVGGKYKSSNTVIVDAGHGGFDGGAVASDGTLEKDLNLKIAKKLSCLLKFFGYDVIMTRIEDTATDNTDSSKIAVRKKSDMTNRLKLMDNNPDAIYVGVHLNKFTTSAAYGAQMFYSPNENGSKILGESIQNAFKTLQPDNDRVIKRGTKLTYLLYNAKIPAVIAECGFLSNTSELQRLKDNTYQTKNAMCILSGILNYTVGEKNGKQD